MTVKELKHKVDADSIKKDKNSLTIDDLRKHGISEEEIDNALELVELMDGEYELYLPTAKDFKELHRKRAKGEVWLRSKKPIKINDERDRTF